MTQKQGKTKDVIPFTTPPGTKWNEVKISFVDKENVKITIRGKAEKRHFSEMGFRNAKSGKAICLWGFLKGLASLSGRYTNCRDIDRVKVRGYFKDLRKTLKHYFKTIQSDPVPYKDTQEYKGYETAFTIEGNSNDDYENETRKHLREYVKPKNEYRTDDSEDKDADLND